jgi:hypothetical protein
LLFYSIIKVLPVPFEIINRGIKMTNQINIEPQIQLVEDILVPWQDRIGVDYKGYKNHVYRMLHCCFALTSLNSEQREKLIIAACFHDIGLWSDHTVDYLPPSIREAMQYLRLNHLEDWEEEITLLIDLHHKIRPIQAELNHKYPLLEVFRKADLADFSLGLILGGVPASYMQQLKQQFPNQGFHKMLMKSGVQWFSKHPLSPPPFMKW